MSSLRLNFSSLIAFLLPGFVAVYGFSFLFPTLGAVVASLSQPTANVAGPLLIFFLTSLAVGLALSSLRSAAWDRLCAKLQGCQPLPYAALTSKSRIEAFNAAVEGTYRYYQYSGNMGIALLILAIGRSRFWAEVPLTFSFTQLGVTLAAFALLAASYSQHESTHNQLRSILEGMLSRNTLPGRGTDASVEGPKKIEQQKRRSAEGRKESGQKVSNQEQVIGQSEEKR